MASDDFATRIIAWQRRHGRHDLPWQGTRDPYRIWVSEIMLQQTQVATVIPYYQRFLARFPDVATLAATDEEAVLAHWSGLGYYARARNLHRAAQEIVAHHQGRIPADPRTLAALPGMGRSTAAAVAVFAFGTRAAILDGNVKRVLSRHAGIAGWPGDKRVEAQLWAVAEARLPQQEVGGYSQGLMDLGATICTRARPACALCPVHEDCVARHTGRTGELPSPRPRKPLPERAVAVLVLLAGDAVLLEKRPATGVWGGLWSLPEALMEEDCAQVALRLGQRPLRSRALPAFMHDFTHFRLRIEPHLVEVQPVRQVAEPGRLWLPLSELQGAALPAPVRRLLKGVAEERAWLIRS
ncbi:A/G-specific adenine glycosylase [Thiobacter aerophilum]|uniref:Adenine DNA glycosylase n=1 Tax=Thiobacter aerophilum TaxID=3121275 RepID=A0ABV0ECD6_9BURK